MAETKTYAARLGPGSNAIPDKGAKKKPWQQKDQPKEE
jgi:hypothetical protein